MKILVFMFEGLISYNKENMNIFYSPPRRRAPGKKNIFLNKVLLLELELFGFVFVETALKNKKANR